MNFENMMLEEQLEGEYAETYKKISAYTMTRNMEGETEEEMMMNLLDMLLTAQNDGKPVEKIVGNDIEQFCKTYFEGYTMKVILTEQFPKQTYRWMWCVFIIELIALLFQMGAGFSLMQATTDISGFILGLVIGSIIVALSGIVLKPIIFRFKKLNIKLLSTMILMISIVLIIIGVILLDAYEIRFPCIYSVGVSGCYILCYIIARSVQRYFKHGTFFKKNLPFHTSWKSNIKNDVEEQLPQELVKQYTKINERRKRRNKEEMSVEQYMEKLKKDTKVAEIAKVIGYIVVIGVIVGMPVHEAIVNNPVDASILFIILLIAEIPVLLFFRCLSYGLRVRERILAECKEQCVDIIEYANDFCK